MDIYLIRHGDAESGSGIKTDFERQLTPQGVEILKKAAAGWKNTLKGFDYIISSPYKRAVQTAQIVAEAFNMTDKIVIENRMGCGARTDDVLNIANSIKAEIIAFVGHEPDLSNHVSELISGNGCNVEFKKGMIAKISFGSKARFTKGVLRFMMPTDVFCA